MKIPKVTKNKPYIEFRINKKGKLKLSITNIWWGGKDSGFFSSDGTEGNTCKPTNLKVYIEAFKNRKIKNIQKEIQILQNQLNKIESFDWKL